MSPPTHPRRAKPDQMVKALADCLRRLPIERSIGVILDVLSEADRIGTLTIVTRQLVEKPFVFPEPICRGLRAWYFRLGLRAWYSR